MKRSILYYPTIDLKDNIWLRNAILYWDEICTIVPDENNHPSSSIIYSLQENNLYRPVYPAKLLQNFDLRKNFTEDFLLAYRNSRSFSMKKDKNSVFEEIHYEKMAPSLYNFLFKQGKISFKHGSEWISIDSSTSLIYMSTLAAHLAKNDEEAMAVGTDRYQYIGSAFRPIPSATNNFCLSALYKKIFPTPNLEVPITEIISFKSKRTNELKRFQQEMSNFEKDLSFCTEIEEIKNITQAFETRLKLSLAEMDKLFKDSKISFHLGNMGTVIDMAATTDSICSIIKEICSSNSYPNFPILSGVFCAGTVIKVGIRSLRYKNELNQQRKNSGFGYVYDGVQKGILTRDK